MVFVELEGVVEEATGTATMEESETAVAADAEMGAAEDDGLLDEGGVVGAFD